MIKKLIWLDWIFIVAMAYQGFITYMNLNEPLDYPTFLFYMIVTITLYLIIKLFIKRRR